MAIKAFSDLSRVRTDCNGVNHVGNDQVRSKALSTSAATTSKQHCWMLQVERFFRQSRTLLRYRCWCGRGLGAENITEYEPSKEFCLQAPVSTNRFMLLRTSASWKLPLDDSQSESAMHSFTFLNSLRTRIKFNTLIRVRRLTLKL